MISFSSQIRFFFYKNIKYKFTTYKMMSLSETDFGLMKISMRDESTEMEL